MFSFWPKISAGGEMIFGKMSFEHASYQELPECIVVGKEKGGIQC